MTQAAVSLLFVLVLWYQFSRARQEENRRDIVTRVDPDANTPEIMPVDQDAHPVPPDYHQN